MCCTHSEIFGSHHQEWRIWAAAVLYEPICWHVNVTCVQGMLNLDSSEPTTPLYAAHLWCSYSKAKMKKIQVAFNDTLGILLKLPRWTNASHICLWLVMFPISMVSRNFMHTFKCRLNDSIQALITFLSRHRVIWWEVFFLFLETLEQVFVFKQLFICND